MEGVRTWLETCRRSQQEEWIFEREVTNDKDALVCAVELLRDPDVTDVCVRRGTGQKAVCCCSETVNLSDEYAKLIGRRLRAYRDVAQSR